MEGASLLTSLAVTELLKLAIKWTQAAVKCKSQCKKLQEELLMIVPDVERIERRLAQLRNASRKRGDPQLEDLAMVGAWLRQLNSAVVGAKDDVHRCNSGRISLDGIGLSGRLTEHYDNITRLGAQRATLFLLLRNLMPVVPAQADVLDRSVEQGGRPSEHGAHWLRQGRQPSDVTVCHRDGQQHTHLVWQHAMAGESLVQMKRAFGHDPSPARGNWKY